jgi:hypothetical protein
MTQPSDFLILTDRTAVRSWSVRRLPFEAKGAMATYRAALRDGVGQLNPSVGLHCVYSSASDDFCDTENVLLYNVGMSAFGHVTSEGLTFERSFSVPPPPHELSGPSLHSCIYTTGDDWRAFRNWETTESVVSGVAPIPSREAKAADWWWACEPRSPAAQDLTGSMFGLRVKVSNPRRSTGSLLKPMLDGLIAALHDDPDASAESVHRLAVYLGVEPISVSKRLSIAGPLGSRTVVRAFRDGLQWNPADDLCVACTVEVVSEPGPGRIEWELLRMSAMDPKDSEYQSTHCATRPRP